MLNRLEMNLAFFDLFTMGGGVPIVEGRLLEGFSIYRKDIKIILYDPFGDITDIMQIEKKRIINNKNTFVINLDFDISIKKIKELSFIKKMILFIKLIKYSIVIAKENKRYKVDYIIFGLPKSGLLIYLSKLFYKKPKMVFHFHGVQYLSDINIFYKLLFKKADIIVPVSEGTKGQLIEMNVQSEKIYVIYNALDYDLKMVTDKKQLKKRLNLKEEKFIIGYVGNIIRRKGVDLLIKAFAKLKRNPKYNNMILIIVGGNPNEENGSYIAEIKEIIKKENLEDSILFLGYRNDAREIMQVFDIFVMPSRMESFGVAIIEAMSYGVPVIVTNGGSITEIVRNNENGIVVECENYDSIAYAIETLYRNEEKRKKISINAINDVKERFSLYNQINNFSALLLRFMDDTKSYRRWKK